VAGVLDTIETIVADDDADSLVFAQQRGFAEDRREKGISLDLTRIEPPTVEPPEGVQITTSAERPELVRGMYEVVLEAAPDIPGGEGEAIEPFEDWLAAPPDAACQPAIFVHLPCRRGDLRDRLAWRMTGSCVTRRGGISTSASSCLGGRGTRPIVGSG
jgi:hypothetical protein